MGCILSYLKIFYYVFEIVYQMQFFVFGFYLYFVVVIFGYGLDIFIFG